MNEEELRKARAISLLNVSIEDYLESSHKLEVYSDVIAAITEDNPTKNKKHEELISGSLDRTFYNLVQFITRANALYATYEIVMEIYPELKNDFEKVDEVIRNQRQIVDGLEKTISKTLQRFAELRLEQNNHK